MTKKFHKPERYPIRLNPTDISSIRSNLHMDINSFAVKCGASGATVQNWERGTHVPSPIHMANLFLIRQTGRSVMDLYLPENGAKV